MAQQFPLPTLVRDRGRGRRRVDAHVREAAYRTTTKVQARPSAYTRRYCGPFHIGVRDASSDEIKNWGNRLGGYWGAHH